MDCGEIEGYKQGYARPLKISLVNEQHQPARMSDDQSKCSTRLTTPTLQILKMNERDSYHPMSCQKIRMWLREALLMSRSQELVWATSSNNNFLYDG